MVVGAAAAAAVGIATTRHGTWTHWRGPDTSLGCLDIVVAVVVGTTFGFDLFDSSDSDMGAVKRSATT